MFDTTPSISERYPAAVRGSQAPGGEDAPPGLTGIAGCPDAAITPGTIVPAWYGERLNLDYAIATCFANAANREKREKAAAA